MACVLLLAACGLRLAAAARTSDQILADLDAESAKVHSALPSPEALLDEKERAKLAPGLLPALRRSRELVDELRRTGNPDARRVVRGFEMNTLPVLALLGDADAGKRIETLAGSDEREDALSGAGARLLLHWLETAHDEAKQRQVLDEAKSLARANPSSERLTGLLSDLSESGPASPDLADAVQDVAASMRSLHAARVRMAVEQRNKLKTLEGKPLVIKARQFDGTDFSSDAWKGKVILVDFWSTGCVPCVAELPKLKALYDRYHDAGFEVVSLSCDEEPAQLEQFFREHREQMPWPQLYDVNHPGWHPLAIEYGVDSTPAMFVIDRKGIVVSARAQNQFEKVVTDAMSEGK